MEKEDRGTILIVDDNTENIKLAVRYLKEESYRTAFATSGKQCLALVQEHLYDLILLDVMMPEMDGFETCRRIKELPQYRDIPVIFLTARTDKDSVVEGLERGGADYITKPFHGQELSLRVGTHIELKKSREKLEEINAELQKEILVGMKISEELEQSKKELQRANQELHLIATTDPLTGMMNRRRIVDFLDYEAGRMNRTGGTYSVLMCDIDHFKAVNDTYGHETGDVVLKKVAAVLLEEIRDQDKAARWGGEEFLLLLPDTEGKGAITLAEKLRVAIGSLKTEVDGVTLQVTMTFGAALSTKNIDFDEVIRRADTALYQGKESGRNCSVLFQSR
jgi:diguanylate cyclase (GGDEF)-like protein